MALTEQLISYGVALELATVKEEQQAEALALVRDQELRQARATIRDRFHLPLVTCGFDVTDPRLPGGVCEACPKNSKTQRTLWEQTTSEDPRCTDRTCYEAKKATTWERRKASAEAAGATVLEGEEAAKLYPDRWSTAPAGKLIDLDRPCEDDPAAEAGKEKRTWREVLGASITPSLLVRDHRGEARELVTFEAAAAAASAAGEASLAEAIQEEVDYEPPPPLPRRDHQAERAAEKCAAERALPLILAEFGKLSETVVWRWIARTLARADADALGEKIAEAAARRAIKASETDEAAGEPWDPLPPLLAWIEEARSGGARALALELLITSYGVSGELDEEHPFASAAKLTGVDLGGMRREAFAAAGTKSEEREPTEGEVN